MARVGRGFPLHPNLRLHPARPAGITTRTATDSLGTNDVATRAVQSFTLAATDTLATTDAATRTAQTFTRAASDALGTSDAATRTTRTITRTASDSLSTGDSATRAVQTLTRSATDALGTTDSATRLVVLPRTTSDALGTSDAAAHAAQTPTRNATDTLGTSDVATRTAQAFPRFARDYLQPEYRTLVLAESTAASYIRLGDANGSATVADSIGAVTGTVGTGITLGVTGLVGGDANTAAQGAPGTIDFGDNYDFAGNTPFTIEFILNPGAFGQRVVSKADGSGGWSVDLDASGHVTAARRG